MKDWLKFIFLPLFLFIILSSLIYLISLISIENKVLQILIQLISSLSIILIPYSMLRLAPTYAYTLTLIYMLGIATTIMLIQAYFSFAQLDYKFIYISLFWIVCAIAIHFFYTDKKNKLRNNE